MAHEDIPRGPFSSEEVSGSQSSATLDHSTVDGHRHYRAHGWPRPSISKLGKAALVARPKTSRMFAHD